MRWRSIVPIAAFGALLAGLACQKGGSSAEIPVGEYSSLTGTTATFGQSTHNAILMAFDEVNKAGGVLGKQVKDSVEDNRSNPERPAIAATKLINSSTWSPCSERSRRRARSPRAPSPRAPGSP